MGNPNYEFLGKVKMVCFFQLVLGKERFGARGTKNPFTIGSDLELPLGFDQHVLERFIKLIRLEKDNCLAILLVSFSALG